MTERLYSIIKVCSRTLGLTLLSVFAALNAYAQGGTVSGTVKGPDGDPLIGATVFAVGTSTAVITGVDGSYSIRVPEGVTELRITYIGYDEQTVPIGTRAVIDITLQEQLTALDEVVVIGYGVQKRRDLTGSVASVGEKVLSAMPVASAAEAISGRMAGVVVTTSEGGPDAEINIRVRGGGSITQDNSPLYIVDGFPVSSINDIAPSDIQSIDVLKDASSTAIYGARGANGVIIVTTKSGQAGKVKVSFNGYVGFSKIAKTLDMLDPYEYVMWQWELAAYNNSEANMKSFTKYYGEFDDLDLYKGKKGTNWQKEIFGRTALNQNYNLGVSGGSDNVKFNISLAHTDNESIMIGSDYQRSNIAAKINAKLNKKITVDFNARWSHTATTGPGTSSNSSIPRLRHTLKYQPVSGIAEFVENDDEFINEIETSSQLLNPLKATIDEYRKQVRFEQSYNGAFTWKIIKQLTFRSEFGITTQDNNQDRYYGLNTNTAQKTGGKPVVTKNDTQTFRWRVANTLTYMPDLGNNHDLTVLLGQETNSYQSKAVDMEVINYSKSTTRKQALANIGLGDINSKSTTVSAADNMLSFFGRANYTLKGRYMLTATLRADGSSKFPESNRWGWFPSMAAAWRISDESWMENSKSWLYDLKLRGSYGTAGNNRISDGLWQYLYETKGGNKFISMNNEKMDVIVPTKALPNTDLKWETTITRNIGVDFGFWGGRLNGTVDFYWNTTKDLLIEASIPESSGFTSQYQNIGSTSNKGVELTLDGTIVSTKDFRLGASFNIAFNRNKVDKLGEAKSFTANSGWYSSKVSSDFLIQEGKPLGQIYGYVTDGMYTFQDFNPVYNPETGVVTWNLADGAVTPGGTSSPVLPGTLKFKDLDESGDISSTGDRTVIGNTQPDFTGGFNINAQWKNFDLALYFNYMIGNDVYNANKLELTSYPETRRYGNLLSTMENRFTYIDRETGKSLINDIEGLMAANRNATMWSPIISEVPIHSWAVEDGSFLRLSNVTLGYTLPRRILDKIRIDNIRVYVTGTNLWLWTKYTGYDPEVDTRRSTPLTPGVDYSAFPRSRQFIVGLNVTF